MTTRTFKQCGQAYGSTPASITATIDGTVVFSGPVTTVNTPLPNFPYTGTEPLPNLFTWTNTVAFAGAQSISIAVTGSPLLLDDTTANYGQRSDSDSAKFRPFYFQTIDGITVPDTFTNVAIDGVAKQRGPDNSTLPGQWQWVIPAGSSFTATLNVNAGQDKPV